MLVHPFLKTLLELAGVVSCIDPEKQKYAIYVKVLGLQPQYSAPGGNGKIVDNKCANDCTSLKVDQVSRSPGC